MGFTFVDLFAGIGGFHLALGNLGGRAVFVSEKDPHARAIYERNFGPSVDGDIVGDIVPLTRGRLDSRIGNHDILTAGFPCQPFSKSGFQRGISETRGTLFYNIAKVIESRRPRVVLLENVRNLLGVRHIATWELIRRTLLELGYATSVRPTVFSPHLLPKELLGTPQVRERVFIVAVRVGPKRASAIQDLPLLLPNRPVEGWDPKQWNLRESVIQADITAEEALSSSLSDQDEHVLEIWDDFVRSLGVEGKRRLPGHPLWSDEFGRSTEIDNSWPAWKKDFVNKNANFYRQFRGEIDAWLSRNPPLRRFPASRRKFEWQAQDMQSLWDGLIQMRPSGIRVKPANYAPALVAINQRSIYGPLRRRLTTREAARLQGFPDTFSFGSQPDAQSFKQLGNAVSVGVATQILRQAAYEWPIFPTDIGEQILGAGDDLGLPNVRLAFGQRMNEAQP